MTEVKQQARDAATVTSRSTVPVLRRRPDRAGRALTSMATVERLLERSDAELVAATFSGEPSERFLHAHLAALRAGAAVVEAEAACAGVRPARRGRPRPVWELVAAAEPGLRRWTAVFAAAAPLRAAVESGRGEVDDERADLALAAAEAFGDEVRTLLAGSTASQAHGRSVGLRAS